MMREKPGRFCYGSFAPPRPETGVCTRRDLFSVIFLRVLFVELFVEPVCRELEDQDEKDEHYDIE